MSARGNKPVGRVARLLMLLCAALILIAIVVGVVAVRERQAYPARGAASLPGQAAGGGAQPGDRPGAE